MKSLKLITAGLLAAVSISTASATDLYVTGSTAYRKALYASIISYLGAGAKAACVGSALNGSNQATFTNGTDTVYCCMAGSVGGVNWLENNLNVGLAPANLNNPSLGGVNPTKAFVAVANATTLATIIGGQASGGNVGLTDVPATWTGVAHAANVSMSDSFQNSTPFTDGSAPFITLQDGGTAASPVGVVLFTFAKGKNHPAVPAASYNRFTNVSPLAFQFIAANGIAPLSLFTGNSADHAYDVVLVGRDNDSGTRLAAMFETGLGSVNYPAKQYLAFSGATTDIGLTGGATFDNLHTAFANAGYSSGSGVKNVLNATASGAGVLDSNGKPFIVLGYVGTGDLPAANQIAPTGQILSYNGVGLYDSGAVQQPALAQYGQYTFWTQEHLYYVAPATGTAYDISPAAKTIADGIANVMTSTYATSAGGLLNSSMQCNRGAEGAVVNPL